MTVMTRTETEAFLGDVLEIARRMVESGAEIRRVEDTMQRICTAYGFTVTNSFAILTMAQLTVRSPEGEIFTQSVRIAQAGMDLGAIERLNTWARMLCEKTPPISEISHMPEFGVQNCSLAFGRRKSSANKPQKANKKRKPKKEKEKEEKDRRWVAALIGYPVVSGAFSIFFGGGLREGIASALIGIVIFLMDYFLMLRRQNRIIYTVIACFIAGCLAQLCKLSGLCVGVENVMIGDVMLFIPTLAVVNGVKEMLYRDMTTGLSRFTESLLVAAAIGGGFVLSILAFGGAFDSSPVGVAPSVPLQLITAGIGTWGFVLFTHVRARHFIPAVAGGVMSWALYLFLESETGNVFLASLIAAMAVGIWSEMMARAMKAPANLFLIPGIVPLLPGKNLYYTVLSMLLGGTEVFFAAGRETLLGVVGIVVGIVASSIFFIYLLGVAVAFRKKHAERKIR